ncbi:uncharacterized protein LOC132884553 [Neoarius graeffei]|uniref:uncharacterized protein LOC132884553 n=1 Tax=Neoarius graeffei TaxID=443677 RepID=UPI00298C0496|nr:uncharacterized protein LOC132884553 [Neoarius graeffei]
MGFSVVPASGGGRTRPHRHLCLGDGFQAADCPETIVSECWRVLKVTRDPAPAVGLWLLEKPLFFNSLIRAEILSSASLRSSLREAGCVKLGYLLMSMEVLEQIINISRRLLSRVVEEVLGSLPEGLKAFIMEDASLPDHWDEAAEYAFPHLDVSANIAEWQEGEDHLLSFRTPQLGKFKGLGKKALYYTCESTELSVTSGHKSIEVG